MGEHNALLPQHLHHRLPQRFALLVIHQRFHHEELLLCFQGDGGKHHIKGFLKFSKLVRRHTFGKLNFREHFRQGRQEKPGYRNSILTDHHSLRAGTSTFQLSLFGDVGPDNQGDIRQFLFRDFLSGQAFQRRNRLANQIVEILIGRKDIVCDVQSHMEVIPNPIQSRLTVVDQQFLQFLPLPDVDTGQPFIILNGLFHRFLNFQRLVHVPSHGNGLYLHTLHMRRQVHDFKGILDVALIRQHPHNRILFGSGNMSEAVRDLIQHQSMGNTIKDNGKETAVAFHHLSGKSHLQFTFDFQKHVLCALYVFPGDPAQFSCQKTVPVLHQQAVEDREDHLPLIIFRSNHAVTGLPSVIQGQSAAFQLGIHLL